MLALLLGVQAVTLQELRVTLQERYARLVQPKVHRVAGTGLRKDHVHLDVALMNLPLVEGAGVTRACTAAGAFE